MIALILAGACVLVALGILAFMMTEAGTMALICAIVAVGGIVAAPFLRIERGDK